MDLECLPNEILEVIFSFLDGASLIRSRATCRRWNALICSSLQGGRASWKNLCLREIRKDALFELLGNKQQAEDTHQLWMKTYVAFHRSQSVKSYPCLIKKIPLDDDLSRITCAKVSGECLITGNVSGNVWLWSTALGKPLQPLCKHMKPVTDIVLVDLLNLGRYKANGFITGHHHAISCGQDRTLKIMPLQFPEEDINLSSIPITGKVHCLRIFDNILMALSKEGHIFIWEMNVTASSSPEMTLVPFSNSLKDLPGTCCYIGVWKDEVSVITDNLDKYTYDLKEKKWTSLSAPSLHDPTGIGNGVLSNINIKGCFLFHEKISVFLTVNNYLGISVDGHRYHLYSTLASLKSYVTAVKVYCNLFILGTNTGGIYLYLYKKKEDLLNLNLDKPLWSKVFLPAAINYIDVWLNVKKITMVTVIDRNIYVVQWIPKSRQLPMNTIFS